MRYTLALLPLLVACGGSTRAADILALTGDAASGETLFVDNCESCHGVAGVGGSGPALAGDFEAEEEDINVILDGEEDMPGFADSLSDQDIADIAEYLLSL